MLFRSWKEYNNNKLFGSAIPYIKLANIEEYLLPIPPTAEQSRIVERLEKLEPLIEKYDALEKQATKLDSEIKDKLRKSILQYAIQGKLVPQDKNDEPASMLLERIRKEKKAELGKKYVESYIYKGDDNCYYEHVGDNTVEIAENLSQNQIPASWAWSRLGQVIELLSGRDLTTKEYSNTKTTGVPYITGASNFSDGHLLINRWTNHPKTVSKLNDLLITCKGTIGDIAYNNIGDIHIARQIMAISSTLLNVEYIELFLRSYLSILLTKAKSMIPGISRKDINDAIVPIPPLKEQYRIVDKANIIFSLLRE